MSTARRILASLIGVILVLTIILGWVLWHRHTTQAEAEATAQTQQQTQTPSDTTNQVTANHTSKELQDAAIRLETAMRDWGTDPTIDPSSLKGQDAGTVLQQLRGSAPATPIADMVASPIPQEDGPDAPNPACNGTDDPSKLCTGWKNTAEWWSGQAWGYGAKWTDGPTATANTDGTVTVEGTVRAILVGKDTFGMPDAQYKAITPAWQDYTVTDIITFDKDLKATNINHKGIDPWWIDPWMKPWNDSMVDAMEGGRRVAIPVTGTLTYDGLLWDTETAQLSTPATQGDLDGKVDWSLWDGLMNLGGGQTCQNPVACG